MGAPIVYIFLLNDDTETLHRHYMEDSEKMQNGQGAGKKYIKKKGKKRMNKGNRAVKKAFALLLSLVMVVCMMPGTAFAGGDTTNEQSVPSAQAGQNGFQADEYLAELRFVSGNNAIPDYPITQNGQNEYATVVQDYATAVQLYAFVVLSDSAPEGSKATIVYQNISGKEKVVSLTPGTNNRLLQCIKPNTLTGNTLTLTVGTEDQKQVYTIHVVRRATLKSLLVQSEDAAELSFAPAFSKEPDDYTLNSLLEKNQSLKVNPTAAASSEAKITINGQPVESGADNVIQPVWNGSTGIITIQAAAEDPSLNAEPTTYTITCHQAVESIQIKTQPAKTTYLDGEAFDPAGMEVEAVYADGQTEAIDSYTLDEGAENLSVGTTSVIVRYGDKTASVPVTVKERYTGEGTKDAPYLISTTADLQYLSTTVKNGSTYEGKFFLMTTDLTLPEDWTPIGALKSGAEDAGAGKNINPFSGTFDGGGNKITVPDGGLPLFGYVRNGTIRNLDIYGTKIASDGLINNYEVDYGPTGKNDYKTVYGINIDSVTLLSGSSTLRSGLLSGYASGMNQVTITNCTVEPGVTIGYDGNQSNIGSFAGGFNGTLTNCVSAATVKGVNFVGGIIGDRGQTMGPCNVNNCEFTGSVDASGSYAGGIAGSGYSGTRLGLVSAPNTPSITIQNCKATGTVKGSDYVGGILGAEPGQVQCWDNGIGYVRNNLFTGTLDADGAQYKGGVIGYMNSLNIHNVVENNYFAQGCGAETGIGFIKYIDTNCETKDTTQGAEYYNTEGVIETGTGLDGFPAGFIRADQNRSDDPAGADADKLSRSATAAELKDGTITALLNNGPGSYKNWAQGEISPIHGSAASTVTAILTLDPNGGNVDGSTLPKDYQYTAYMSDQTLPTPLERSGYEFLGWYLGQQRYTTYPDGPKNLTLTAHWKKVETTAPSENNITVTFRLIGSTLSKGAVNLSDGDYKGASYVTWIPTKTYTMPEGSTVYDLYTKALADAGIKSVGQEANYVKTIYAPAIHGGYALSEFTNGNNSGWMYTINGVHPLFGLQEQKLNQGDAVIWHYVNDYAWEVEDWGATGGSGWPQLSTQEKNYWNKWLEVADIAPTTPLPEETVSASKDIPASIKGDSAEASVSASDMAALVDAVKKDGSAAVQLNVTGADKAAEISLELPKT